jgi:hypothetical protein
VSSESAHLLVLLADGQFQLVLLVAALDRQLDLVSRLVLGDFFAGRLDFFCRQALLLEL